MNKPRTTYYLIPKHGDINKWSRCASLNYEDFFIMDQAGYDDIENFNEIEAFQIIVHRTVQLLPNRLYLDLN